MRQMVLAFWLGAAVASFVFMLTSTATTFDADVTVGESQPLRFAQRVDQAEVSRLLAPSALALGALRLTKRGWGLVTTYTEDLTIARGPLPALAETAGGIRITLDMPGTVVATNADGRDGRLLVWSAGNVAGGAGPLRAQTRAVNWPLVVFLAAAVAVSFWARAA
jgi:hypothetical protein